MSSQHITVLAPPVIVAPRGAQWAAAAALWIARALSTRQAGALRPVLKAAP
jgi:hypothetical protein